MDSTDESKYLSVEVKAKEKKKAKRRQELESYLAENPGIEYTPELLAQMKAAGMAKPDSVEPWQWRNNLLELKPHHYQIVFMAAQGLKNNAIAKISGLPVSQVASVVKSELGKREIARISNQFWGGKADKMFNEIIPHAVRTSFQIMQDERVKPQTRIDAAFKFLDRALGKPLQQVETKDASVRQLYEKMDELIKMNQAQVVESQTLGPPVSPEVQDASFVPLTQESEAVTLSQTTPQPQESAQDTAQDAKIAKWVKENLG